MSTPAPTAPAAPVAVEERGRLDIHPTVLRKIVEHVADGVPGTLHRERSVAGFDAGDAGIKAKVTAGAGEPTAVDVRLDLALRYPGSVRDVVAALRAEVGAELERIAGHHVRHLDVNVTGLRAAPAAPAVQ